MRRATVGILALAVVSGGARGDVTTPTSPSKLPAGSVPKVLIDEWRKAENRATCAPVWFDDVGGAQPRARYFGGGWGVTVKARAGSSWGVAGAGVIASPHDLDKWQFHRDGAGGIRAGYGLEGFTIGPDWLAYVIVPGQKCLYNLWSRSGRAHLEHLVDHLRLVDVR